MKPVKAPIKVRIEKPTSTLPTEDIVLTFHYEKNVSL